jgi:hypothetical protein
MDIPRECNTRVLLPYLQSDLTRIRHEWYSLFEMPKEPGVLYLGVHFRASCLRTGTYMERSKNWHWPCVAPDRKAVRGGRGANLIFSHVVRARGVMDL